MFTKLLTPPSIPMPQHMLMLNSELFLNKFIPGLVGTRYNYSVYLVYLV